MSAPRSGAPPTAVQPWQLACAEVAPDMVLDLRGHDRFVRGHLPGARCVPYLAFQHEAEQLCEGAQLVLVVDAGGARAAEMATWLSGRGVRTAWLEGGMAAWKGPLETRP